MGERREITSVDLFIFVYVFVTKARRRGGDSREIGTHLPPTQQHRCVYIEFPRGTFDASRSVASVMLRAAEQIGSLDLHAKRCATHVVEMSETDSHVTDRQLDEIDLRGLVCSTIHEYRVREIPAELGFIDEHPYAIIKGDRAAAIEIVRTFFDFALQESSGQRLTVRLYSLGEELYIAVTGEAELPVPSAPISSKGEPSNLKEVSSRRHRLGLTKGWLRFSNSTEPGATLTMSFGSS